MLKLGRISSVLNRDWLVPLDLEPFCVCMPSLKPNEVVIGGCDDGTGEILFACHYLSDIQKLQSQKLQGYIRILNWYKTSCLGFMH